MIDNTLLAWFRERRAERIVETLQNHLLKVGDTCIALAKALEALEKSTSTVSEIESTLDLVIMEEKASDRLQDDLFALVFQGEIPSRIRENLLSLGRFNDKIANWQKVSASNAKLALEIKLEVDKKVWGTFLKISHLTIEQVDVLKRMFEDLSSGEGEDILEGRKLVENKEREIDDIYFEMKKDIMKNATTLPYAIILRDLLHGLENSADACASTADVLFSIVMADR